MLTYSAKDGMWKEEPYEWQKYVSSIQTEIFNLFIFNFLQTVNAKKYETFATFKNEFQCLKNRLLLKKNISKIPF